jgi:hypothetical protein
MVGWYYCVCMCVCVWSIGGRWSVVGSGQDHNVVPYVDGIITLLDDAREWRWRYGDPVLVLDESLALLPPAPSIPPSFLTCRTSIPAREHGGDPPCRWWPIRRESGLEREKRIMRQTGETTQAQVGPACPRCLHKLCIVANQRPRGVRFKMHQVVVKAATRRRRQKSGKFHMIARDWAVVGDARFIRNCSASLFYVPFPGTSNAVERSEEVCLARLSLPGASGSQSCPSPAVKRVRPDQD